MRWLILCLFLCAFTQVYPTHDTTEKIDSEISNIENDLQSKQFTVVFATPNLNDLKDGEIVIVSTGSYTKMMFRQNQEIYMINVSCVTVRR